MPREHRIDEQSTLKQQDWQLNTANENEYQQENSLGRARSRGFAKTDCTVQFNSVQFAVSQSAWDAMRPVKKTRATARSWDEVRVKRPSTASLSRNMHAGRVPITSPQFDLYYASNRTPSRVR